MILSTNFCAVYILEVYRIFSSTFTYFFLLMSSIVSNSCFCTNRMSSQISFNRRKLIIHIFSTFIVSFTHFHNSFDFFVILVHAFLEVSFLEVSVLEVSFCFLLVISRSVYVIYKCRFHYEKKIMITSCGWVYCSTK